MSEAPLYAMQSNASRGVKEIDVLLLNHQRQHRTVHIEKDVLPYALC